MTDAARMPPPDDDTQARISAAIWAEVVKAVERRLTVGEAVGTATRNVLGVLDAAAIGDASPRETASERWRRENAAALAQMAELERQGRGRSAAMIVAKRFAVDKLDAREIWNLAQRFRSQRRAQK